MPFKKALRRTLIIPALLAGLPALAAETVKIGFIEILSGPFAHTGEISLKQLREVVTQVNAKAGPNDPKFEVVPLDGKGSPQESANQVKAATDQGIRYVTQGGGSGVAFAISDAVAKQADRDPGKTMLYLNYAAMDPGLTNDRCNFWHFRFYPSSTMKIEALTTYLKKRPEVKKVFLINQDYTHGHQVAKAAKDYLAKKRPDIQIVGEDLVPIYRVRDFAPYIAKIRASGADTVITSNWGTDLSLLFKAAKENNLNIRYFTMNANNPDVPTAIGAWNAGNVYVMWNWVHNAPTPELENIYLDYKAKYNEEFIFAAHWNSMHMLAAAMRQAKSTDPKAVAIALEGMKYKSPVGDVEMRKDDHQLQAPIFLGVWSQQGTKGVKFDAERTGYGFKSEAIWDARSAMQPTTCQMKRPS